jgi:hypothetical protein
MAIVWVASSSLASVAEAAPPKKKKGEAPAAEPAAETAAEPASVPAADAGATAPTESTSTPSTSTGGTALVAAILPVEVTAGELSDVDKQTLVEAATKGLERGAFTTLTGARVAEVVGGDASCESKRCQRALGDELGATHAVRVRVSRKDRDYEAELVLLDLQQGRSLATTKDACEICGVADVQSLVEAGAATLAVKLEALASGPSTLQLTSDPAGAVVTLDGEIVGTTPLEVPVIPGKQIVRVSLEGYIAVEREVTFVEGVRENLEFTLEKLPSRLPGRAFGASMVAIGAAGLGTGLAFTALHGEENQLACSAAEGTKDEAGNCKYLWDTKWVGASVGIVGAGLLTAGIVVLIDKATRKAAGRGRVSPEKAEATSRLRRRMAPTAGGIAFRF